VVLLRDLVVVAGSSSFLQPAKAKIEMLNSARPINLMLVACCLMLDACHICFYFSF
jgi:hypothetical protein